RKKPAAGALSIALLAALSDALLLWRNPTPKGELLWCVILIGLACVAAAVVFAFILKNPAFGVMGTSLAGAVAHNVGQILAASSVLHTPQLLWTYLPVLVGIGAAVGCLTGFVAQRVFKALKIQFN
ncbi:MAG: Gx transporter family protein, partial [bacterium]